MELRRFRYFVAVAEELHFRRAAERLHLAQPALSQQVRKLEVELGVDLLHRSKRGVALTPAGILFLEEARRLLRQADEAVRTARNARSGTAGRLRLGHVADAVPSLVPRAIAAFAARYPGIELTPEIAPARRAVEDVRAGRLDVAIVGLPVQATGLKVTPLAVEKAVAAVADRHLLSGRGEIEIAALADTPLILLPRPTNPAFYDAVVATCRSVEFAPRLIDTGEALVEHALLLVASGVGIALLPASVAERYKITGVSFRPVAEPAPAIELALVARADPEEVTATAFTRIARDLDADRRDLAAALGGLDSVADLRLSA
jgi:DNA-binding transcriptional LysR family regulator